jgi:hypothetical protein
MGLEKPEALTTLRWSLYHFSICLFIKGLLPAIDGQSNPAPSGQGHRLLQPESRWQSTCHDLPIAHFIDFC